MKSSAKILSLSLMICLAIYIPVIISGVFIVDDWGAIQQAIMHPNWVDNFLSYFPLFANRPLFPIFLVFFSELIQDRPSLYILINIVFWICVLYLSGRQYKRFIPQFSIPFFIIIGSMPVIASSVMFSPVMQLQTSISLLFWILSFKLILDYQKQGRISNLILSSLAVLISLLIYEIAAPLFIFNIFIPSLINQRNSRSKHILDLFKFGMVVLVPIALALIMQKLIIPHYMTVYSRLNTKISLESVLGAGFMWCKMILKDIPQLWWKSLSLKYLSITGAISAIIALVLAFIYFITDTYKSTSHNKKFIWAFIIAPLIVIPFYALAGQNPTIGGYANRGLSSMWLCVSLVLTYIYSYYRRISWVNIILQVVIFITIITFTSTSSQYIKSYKLQIKIIQDVRQKALTADQYKAVIIGDVPRVLSLPFNQEPVFNNSWDFGSAIALDKDSRGVSGNTINQQKASTGNIKISDESLLLDGYWKVVPSDNLWIYVYNQDNQASSLSKITNLEDLEKYVPINQ